MKIIRFHEFGGPDVLRVEDAALPQPGSGEVRIKVAAIGLNRVEAIYRAGIFGPVSFPATIGYEAAGVVDALGTGVDDLAVGDRVAVLYGLSMERYGTCAEQIVYPADRVVRVPASLSLVDAAASWMQYGTAYALVAIAAIVAGDHVLITAASSSVGIAAIQIAIAHGAVPIAVTRTRDKRAALLALGASHVIVSDEQDVTAQIMAITAGQGARVIFDAVGGEALSALLPALASEGTAIVYGMLGGHEAHVPLAALMLRNLTLRGWSADVFTHDPVRRRTLVDYVTAGLASGKLRPVIARTFPFEQVVEAHRYLESNMQVGKVILTTGAAHAPC